MTQTELILKEHLALHVIIGSEFINAAKKTVLEFTKWKDENYITFFDYEIGNIYYPADETKKIINKTSEQLFNEWNNLKNK